jgi:alcohol dehydrogenase
MVTTKEDTREKIGFGYEKTFPVLSVVDPELMMSVPAKLTAYQGFDALFHSTEGYLNTTAFPISDLYALKSIELIGKSLPTAVNHGSDKEARSDVALANTLAGMVESTSGCISEHAIEHAMSALHPNLPHGAGLIMISREYYALITQKGACGERMVRMTRALGNAGAEQATDFVAALTGLQKRCGVDGLKMSDYGIRPAEFPELLKNSRENMGHLYSVDPIRLSDDDVISILQKSYR